MEEKKIRIRFNIMAIVLIIVFCVAISPITLQNDTFYTIKIGEYIMENGIGVEDPFSWHTGIGYTFPHWGYDTMMYLVYNVGGLQGIYISTIVLTAILGIIMYITNVKLTKNRVTSFILTLIAIYLMKDFLAARAQLVTYILFILTVFCIERFLSSRKKGYAIGLVIIPILIANIHVAVFPFYFILYLPYIAEYIAYFVGNSNVTACKLRIKRLNKRRKFYEDSSKLELSVEHKEVNSRNKKIKETTNNERIEELNNKVLELEKRKEELLQRREKLEKNAYKIIINKNNNIKWLIIILVICIFTGLLTPLGTTPYTYLMKTMQGNTVNNISEHLPLTLVQNVNFICVIIVFFAILTFTDTKIRLSDLFMLGGLLVLTFYSRRQESMFIIICVYILNRLICSMFNKYDPNRMQKYRKNSGKRYWENYSSGIGINNIDTDFQTKIKSYFYKRRKLPSKSL